MRRDASEGSGGIDPDLSYAHTMSKNYTQSQIQSSKVRSYLFAIETCLERSRKDARHRRTKIAGHAATGLVVRQHHTFNTVAEGTRTLHDLNCASGTVRKGET